MYNGYRTASDVISGRLYHYEKFCPDRLAALLAKKRVHCANPAKLNDPWDCRVSFDCDLMLRDPEERERMLKINRESLPAEILKDPMRHTYEDLIRNSDEMLINTVEESSKLLTEQLQLRRIYCLTPNPLSTLMWSHYGGNHTGICLEFHIANELFWTALGVKYEEQYPRFLLSQVSDDRALDLILTKAKCWEYEQEYRLIGSPKFAEGVPVKLHDGDFLKLPNRALLSVIVGCNGDFAAVKKIVEEAAPEVRVIQIRRAPNQYNLMMALP